MVVDWEAVKARMRVEMVRVVEVVRVREQGWGMG
jgi:hypothetical protein